MPKNRILSALATAVALPLTFAGCSGNDSGTPTPSTSASPAPSTTASATTPTPTPSVSSSKPAAPPKPRTAAELTKALLTLKDLPSGFSIEPDDGSDGADVTASSKQPGCAQLVALTNADNPPGSKASAAQSFSGGQQGPFIDEQIDALASAQAVAALQAKFRSAITSCKSLTMTVAGEGRSNVTVREVSAPRYGTNPVAVRFTGTDGPFEGVEINMVITGVDDTVIALTVVAGLPEDLDGATEVAVTKAKQSLGAAKSGT